MNYQDFERNIRAGLAASEPSDRVSDKIDQRLASTRQRRTIRLRLTVALAATACLTVGFLVTPIVRAYAEMQRMAGALDNVRSVVMTSVVVRPDGSRQFSARISYLDGRWKIEEPDDKLIYFNNGTRYVHDKATGRTIVETGLKGPFTNNDSSLSLTSLLGDFQRWQPRVHQTIDQAEFHGMSVTRAIAEDPTDPHRIVIYAALDTDLPLEIDQETKENGRWVVTDVQTCDYRTKQTVASFVPDLQAFPPIRKEEYDSNRVKQLVAEDLGSVLLNKGRLVVRAMDVASDGTVFVTSQSGERVPMWNRGYPVDVSDDLGTQYSLLYVQSRIDPEVIARSTDGKVELCVFIPTEPIQPWRPRRITVTARLQSDLVLDRHQWGMWGNRSGQTESMIWYYDKSREFKVVDIARRQFERPTVNTFPTYASIIDPALFDDASHFDQEKAKSRADFYRGLEDTANEFRWLTEVVRSPKSTGERTMAEVRLSDIADHAKPK
jgi:hypothetical protein